MFELPEYNILSAQITSTMKGKTVKAASLGNSPHKFVWYNVSRDEFASAMSGKTLGQAYARGRWLFIDLLPGHVLVIGECGGKILFHENADEIPRKYHLLIRFEDGSAFSVTTRMWGAMELYRKGEERNRQYIKDMRPTPLDAGFTFEYFSRLVDECLASEAKSAKALLTQDQLIPGLGNAIAQDILFNARLHPKYPLKDLSPQRRRDLYDAIIATTKEIISKNGRYDEYDLFNHEGRYVRIMDKNAAGKPCKKCRTPVEKTQYLGGACYYCPICQAPR